MDYGQEHNTWEPVINLNCAEKIEEFEKTRIATVLGVKIVNGTAEYLIKFADTNHSETIATETANKIWPQIIIDFFEKKLEWVASPTSGTSANQPIEENDNTIGDADEILCTYSFVLMTRFIVSKFGVIV